MSTRAEQILDEATERAYADVNLRQAPAAFLRRTVIAASGLPDRLAAAEEDRAAQSSALAKLREENERLRSLLREAFVHVDSPSLRDVIAHALAERTDA